MTLLFIRKDEHVGKDVMFIVPEDGTKKNSEFPTGIEPTVYYNLPCTDRML